MVASPKDIDKLDNEGLRSLLLQVLEENAALRAQVAALREEIRRLKGLKGPPALKPSKPSGMDKATAAKPRKPGRRGPKTPRVAVDEVVLPAEVPPGSRFKGYEDFVVQELVVEPRVTRYRRERWLTPEGATVVAPLSPGLGLGHFGPELRRFVLALYHQGQSTVERITTLLTDFGIDISKRQVQRFLTDKQESFLAEDRAVLRTGLATAAWISVDDTGARHDGRNATCTRIGDHRFASFATTPAKSRLNFLELLAGAEPAYTVNAEALAYMRQRQLPEALIARLAAPPERSFRDRAAWDAHLAALALPAAGSRDPARVASEGALWGGLVARGFADTVILSDDAGQFNVGRHALCWVHAERLVHKLDTFCGRQTRAKETVQAGIWELYRDLKAYCQDPVPIAAAALRQRFERLVATRTRFATLDRLLARLQANRDELLLVLDRPEVPLHTNDAENDLRAVVIRRKLSGGTRSEAGRACRDAFLGLLKTCAKLGIRFWDYLGARLGIPDAPSVPDLGHLVRQAGLA